MVGRYERYALVLSISIHGLYALVLYERWNMTCISSTEVLGFNEMFV